MNDGNNILVTASRQYQKTKPFWYGLSPAFFKTAELNACTHVAFGMGTSKIALLPASIIKDYTKHCGVSKYKTDKIHHYHFFITKAEPHEMYGNQDSPRIALGEYIRKR